MICLVCNSAPAQVHFGAVVCPACAAFFRRYVNTKKSTILCNCNVKRETPYPCRFCRMKKCIAAGMQKDKVQSPRDANKIFENLAIEVKSRDIDRILQTVKSYGALESNRKKIFNEPPQNDFTFYELSLELKADSKLIWALCESAFPEFRQLEDIDKKTLFYNFYSRWGIFESVLFCIKNDDTSNFFSPSGSVCTSVASFYMGAASEKGVLSEQDVLQIFEPFWTFYMNHFIRPIAKLKLSNVENMALLGLMLWDACYANISESLGELCRSMKKIICRQLTAYVEDKDESGKRFFDTLDSLNLIENAERKYQEEMHLCELYNIKVDDMMKNMLNYDKY